MTKDEAMKKMREALETIAAQDSGIPGSAARSDCMAAMALQALGATANIEAPTSEAVAEKPQDDRNAASPAAPALRDGATANGWISVDERLPEWSRRDDKPCSFEGRAIPPMLTSNEVLICTANGIVNMDRLVCIEGGNPWFDHYRYFVTHWMPLPSAPGAQLAADPAPVPAQTGIDGDGVGGATPRRLTEQKTNHIMERDGFQKVGYVLQKPGGDYCISAQSAVRWLDQRDYWRLMHEQDGSLFAKPVSAQGIDHAKRAFDGFMLWAGQHLGQGYRLEREDGTFVDPVTRWAFKAWQARGQQAGGAEE